MPERHGSPPLLHLPQAAVVPTGIRAAEGAGTRTSSMQCFLRSVCTTVLPELVEPAELALQGSCLPCHGSCAEGSESARKFVVAESDDDDDFVVNPLSSGN